MHVPPLSTETRRLRALLVASWALPAAVVAAVIALLGWQVYGLLDLCSWVNHADVVIARAADTERLLVDGESGLRGFLAYGDERYLRSSEEALARLDAALAGLAASVSHEPELLRRVHAVEGDTARWRAYAARALAAARAGEPDPDPAAGELIMDRLRAGLRGLVVDEVRLRDERVAAVRRRTTTWNLTAAALGLAAALALSFAARRALRAVLHRHEAALRAREEFLSVAGHELRTPLTALLLELGRLLRHLPPGEAAPRQIAERALCGGERLAELVVQVLEVPRLVGRVELEAEPVDLGEVARDVVRRSERAARAAGAAVTLEVDPVVGRWDRRRVALAAASLVSNAIKFGKGAVRVRVAVEGAHGVLAVDDGGDGIDAAELARVFGRFERAVPVRHFGGLGLGLWLTQRIAEAHGGRVQVESRPGAGSRFELRLPLDVDRERPAGAAELAR